MSKLMDPLDPRGWATPPADGKMRKYITIVDRNTGLPRMVPFKVSPNGVIINEKGNVFFHNPNDKRDSFPGINLK